EGWKTTNLVDENFFKIQGSGIINFNGEKKYLSTSSIQGNKIISFEKYITFNKRPSRANIQAIIDNIYFAKMRYTLKVIKANNELYNKYILSTGFLGLNTSINSDYLYQFILSDDFNKQKDLYAEGSTQEAINNGDLKNIFITFPQSFQEQQKIAKILSTVDEAIQKTDDLIEKYKKIKTGLMEDLFTKGIDINTGKPHTKFKDSELGKIPESWEVKKLGEVGELTSSKRIFFNEYKKNGIPFYRGKEITKKINNVEINNLLYISTDKFNNIKNNFGVPLEGDILITAVGTLGNVYLVKGTDKFYFKDGNIIWLRKYRQDINKYFLKHFLKEAIYKQQDDLIIGTSQKAFTIKKLKHLKLQIPQSLQEQQKIAEILSSADEKIEKEQAYKQKLENIKKGLMKDLLTGKVRVKV
ncbi:restriction endonuclease subunit S, partial [Candidatus Vampirococcus lugosii]